ncbi:30S ribosomal protein S8e [Candidatus Woesearchaeota archaeon]|nr:30S ribosomal protein S8e [Candidatus Woesearchaeota archaeon]
MLTQSRPKRSSSGSRYIKARDKRLFESGNVPTHTRIGDRQTKLVRVKGGGLKFRTINSNMVNVLDPKSKSYRKAAIKTVVDNPASKHFIRRNIMTRGTVIETELGKARVTNRPGQEGMINAVLI